MGAKLFFYYSAMNAGKSSALLQSSHNYNERGMSTLLFIPKLIGSERIQSRIGLAAPAFVFAPDFDFHAHLAAHQEKASSAEKRCACVLIDEAQFLGQAQVRQLCRVADELQIPVLCFGLRTDFLGEPFEGSRYLLAWADVLSEIKTVCGCGRKATMNQRVADDGTVLAEGEQVQVGGNERYVGKCRRHFWAGIESAGAKPTTTEASAGVAGFVEIVTPEKQKAPAEAPEGAGEAKRARLACSLPSRTGTKRQRKETYVVAEALGDGRRTLRRHETDRTTTSCALSEAMSGEEDEENEENEEE